MMGDLTNPPDRPTIVLITKRQLAAKLRKSLRTVNKMIHRRQLPRPFHIGREAYWNLGTLVAFLERKEKQEQQPPTP